MIIETPRLKDHKIAIVSGNNGSVTIYGTYTNGRACPDVYRGWRNVPLNWTVVGPSPKMEKVVEREVERIIRYYESIEQKVIDNEQKRVRAETIVDRIIKKYRGI